MTESANQTNAGMIQIENDVRREINKGSVFNYKATPNYGGKQWHIDPPVSISVVADEVWPNPNPGRFSKDVQNV
jgi:hypothetical protein